jgi:hypothetical protein
MGSETALSYCLGLPEFVSFLRVGTDLALLAAVTAVLGALPGTQWAPSECLRKEGGVSSQEEIVAVVKLLPTSGPLHMQFWLPPVSLPSCSCCGTCRSLWSSADKAWPVMCSFILSLAGWGVGGGLRSTVRAPGLQAELWRSLLPE